MSELTLLTLPDSYEFADLTREFAVQHLDELTDLANTIPIVEYTQSDILAETKGDRVLHGKWLHGLAVLKSDHLVVFVAAYEREAENNSQYPENTLYISELAVDVEHRHKGIATAMMSQFIKRNNALGLQLLTGKMNYSLQTNAADWNEPVLGLYKSLGFTPRAIKVYSNRTDAILGRRPE